MKTESILFLLAIHEGNELREDLPGSAYDELVIAGLLDGTEITDKGYAYVRHLSDVPVPVQMWVDPRSVAAPAPDVRKSVERPAVLRQPEAPLPITLTIGGVVPNGFSANPGHIPPGVDRASDILIVRNNGKRKTLPAQAINWADQSSPDRVVGWRYAPAGAEGRIHTPGETIPAPDA